MSDFSQNASSKITRRQVLGGAMALTVMCVLDCGPADAQVVDRKIIKALDDPSVEHGAIEFDGGHERIGGYLSRPKAAGKYPVVLVVTGSSYLDEYIQNTTAMLAQAGFVGFAPDIFALQSKAKTGDEKRDILANQITDDYLFADLDASVAYLAKQDFASTDKIGTMGFCFGGRCALMYATHSHKVAAVAPFYGNLKTPAFAKRSHDPVDAADQIHAAVQGHYSKTDDEIPLAQLQKFESDLHQAHTSAEFFTYDAPHGFFAYNRKTYDEAVAQQAWARTIDFFLKNLQLR